MLQRWKQAERMRTQLGFQIEGAGVQTSTVGYLFSRELRRLPRSQGLMEVEGIWEPIAGPEN